MACSRNKRSKHSCQVLLGFHLPGFGPKAGYMIGARLTAPIENRVNGNLALGRLHTTPFLANDEPPRHRRVVSDDLRFCRSRF